ncbi:hypothetical protein B649_05830 [Candidatus Sulfuricurvum sp. RIFRC-1]|nr:hypothetical protein B649_05830 [Candidatus Sulfuricurvum sp. RIFRC-1]
MAALLAFSGCSQKGAFDLFKMDASHERAVEQLRTGAIVLSLETKAILSTLYLNPIYPDQYKDGEYFIAAVYFERDNRDIRKWDLNTYGYTLTLNGKKATILEELNQSDPRRTLIPVQNNWNKYFFIRFDSVADSSLALQLENNRTGKVVLKYQK